MDIETRDINISDGDHIVLNCMQFLPVVHASSPCNERRFGLMSRASTVRTSVGHAMIRGEDERGFAVVEYLVEQFGDIFHASVDNSQILVE